MEYACALKLQATKEILREKRPKRIWKVQLMVLCQVTSSLLLVLSGVAALRKSDRMQASLLAMLASPILFVLVLYVNACSAGCFMQTKIKIDVRVIFLWMLAPAAYSGFGLCRRQKGPLPAIAGMMLLQGVSGAVSVWAWPLDFQHPGLPELCRLPAYLAWCVLCLLYMIDGFEAALSNQASLLSQREDMELRRAIHTRYQTLQNKMATGQLQMATFWNRRGLEMKFVFYFLDILTDANAVAVLFIPVALRRSSEDNGQQDVGQNRKYEYAGCIYFSLKFTKGPELDWMMVFGPLCHG